MREFGFTWSQIGELSEELIVFMAEEAERMRLQDQIDNITAHAVSGGADPSRLIAETMSKIKGPGVNTDRLQQSLFNQWKPGGGGI